MVRSGKPGSPKRWQPGAPTGGPSPTGDCSVWRGLPGLPYRQSCRYGVRDINKSGKSSQREIRPADGEAATGSADEQPDQRIAGAALIVDDGPPERPSPGAGPPEPKLRGAHATRPPGL